MSKFITSAILIWVGVSATMAVQNFMTHQWFGVAACSFAMIACAVVSACRMEALK